MKKRILLLILFTSFISHAQNNTVASGATATGTTGSATYTIGQIVYQTNSGSGGTVFQGVQQPLEISTLSSDEIPQIQLLATVFPNPTVQNVTLSIKEYDLTHLEYNLFDLQGRTISKGKILENETQIEMSHLAASNYFLKVTQANKDLKTFKIIKK